MCTLHNATELIGFLVERTLVNYFWSPRRHYTWIRANETWGSQQHYRFTTDQCDLQSNHSTAWSWGWKMVIPLPLLPMIHLRRRCLHYIDWLSDWLCCETCDARSWCSGCWSWQSEVRKKGKTPLTCWCETFWSVGDMNKSLTQSVSLLLLITQPRHRVSSLLIHWIILKMSRKLDNTSRKYQLPGAKDRFNLNSSSSLTFAFVSPNICPLQV